MILAGPGSRPRRIGSSTRQERRHRPRRGERSSLRAVSSLATTIESLEIQFRRASPSDRDLAVRPVGRGIPGRKFRKASNSGGVAGIAKRNGRDRSLLRVSSAEALRMDRARDRRRFSAESVTRGGDPTGPPTATRGPCILFKWTHSTTSTATSALLVAPGRSSKGVV